MLLSLSIQNYTLIQQLEFNPSDRLNIITGETGAGKSILLGAVGLLLGKRADSNALWDESKKCIIEGNFDISSYSLQHFFEGNDLDYDTEIIIRREISVSGKSRAFVNDTPVRLDTLKELGKELIDIHSQNETILLSSEGYQLAVIDQYSESSRAYSTYNTSFITYQEVKSNLLNLKAREAEIRKSADYNKFLLDELASANLESGQQEILEEELQELENAEEIKRQLNDALEAMTDGDNSSLNSLNAAIIATQQLSKLSAKYQTFFDRIDSLKIELNDVSSELSYLEQNVEHQPERISEIRDRLSLIYQLQQKHQVNSIDELIEIEKDITAQVEQAVSIDQDLALVESEVKDSHDKALKNAYNLRESRMSGMANFGNKIQEILYAIGIPNARVVIEHSEKELSREGIDRISILFSANKGVNPQPLKNVASGGEFSRLMFAIKFLLADKTALPTIIFDEIDAGVSGEVALQLGQLMKKMAENHQVISISHLPQIAAKADRHFHVYKDQVEGKSVSLIKVLSVDEQIEEVAKMISGNQVTDSSLSSARELITR